MLPTAAVCALCNKGDTSSSVTEAADTSSVDQPGMGQLDELSQSQSQCQLMECNVCWSIVHPACLHETYPQFTHDGIINDDLPNSWECPKCCSAGAPKNIKVCHLSSAHLCSSGSLCFSRILQTNLKIFSINCVFMLVRN